MKKLVLILAMIVATLGASAQSYRGFLFLNAGMGTSGENFMVEGEEISNFKPMVSFGLSTSHGCQITPFLFAGLGVGAYLPVAKGELNESSYGDDTTDGVFNALYIPIFADVRWDILLQKKVSPYIGVKAGYQVGVDLSGEFYGDRCCFVSKPQSGFYFEPSIGVRFRTGSSRGINLGFSYNTNMRQSVRALEYSNSDGAEGPEICKVNFGAVMFNFGFDF